MSDATATALLELCRKRTNLLRSALEAFEASAPGTHWCTWTIDAVDVELDAFEAAINARKEGADGRDSD